MTIERCLLCDPTKHCSFIRIGRGRFEHLPHLDVPQRNLTPIESCPTRLDYQDKQEDKAEWEMRVSDSYLGS